MKILGSFLTLLTLIFALSCKTVDIESISNRDYPEVVSNVAESDLPILDISLEKVGYKIYIPYDIPELQGNVSTFKLPIIDLSIDKITFKIFSRDDIDILKKENNLIPVVFIKPEPEPESLPELEPEVLKIVDEPIVTTKIITNNVEPETVNKAPIKAVKPQLIPNRVTNESVVKAEPKVESVSAVIIEPKQDNVITKKVTETIPDKIYVLDDKEVLLSKSFTIDMDQSGWLYKKVINGIDYKNKFYLNDKVLFEFIPQRVGEYTLDFVKYNGTSEEHTRVKINVVSEIQGVDDNNEPTVIVPEKVVDSRSRKKILEDQLKEIRNVNNPDKVYYELAEIYYEEGLLRKAKEYFEYVYDNYPLSIYYREAENKMNYIIDNFLKVR